MQVAFTLTWFACGMAALFALNCPIMGEKQKGPPMYQFTKDALSIAFVLAVMYAGLMSFAAGLSN